MKFLSLTNSLRKPLAILFGLLLCMSFSNSGAQSGKTLLYASDFIPPRPGDEWVIEMQPGEHSSVRTRNGVLILDTEGGVTIWLNRLLKGNIQIEFIRTVKMEGKRNDRLSDLNQFWMASNPHAETLFTRRTGHFSEYDSLRLYYVGMGGNENKTTRFRKYNGRGARLIFGEHTTSSYLLAPNTDYHIRIMVIDGVTTFWVNDRLFFSYVDPDPLKEGYFGFRMLHSRQEIRDLKIFQLP